MQGCATHREVLGMVLEVVRFLFGATSVTGNVMGSGVLDLLNDGKPSRNIAMSCHHSWPAIPLHPQHLPALATPKPLPSPKKEVAMGVVCLRLDHPFFLSLVHALTVFCASLRTIMLIESLARHVEAVHACH
jgi:hypothetical protein